MRALSEVIPIAVTNHAPFKARLAGVATRLQKTDWQEVRQQLPQIPKTAADAAAALHVAVYAPAFLVTKYQGYFIISDVSISAEPSTLPLGDKPQLTAKLRDMLLSDPDAFMSGFAMPVDTAKWIKYDFRKTYTLTPKGVKIGRNTIAEPSSAPIPKKAQK